jgi:hypothetical protein
VTAARGTLHLSRAPLRRPQPAGGGPRERVLGLAGAYMVNDAIQAKRVRARARPRRARDRLPGRPVPRFGPRRGPRQQRHRARDAGQGHRADPVGPCGRAGGASGSAGHVGTGASRAGPVREGRRAVREQPEGTAGAAARGKGTWRRTLSFLGDARYEKGDLAMAEAADREALALRRQVFGDRSRRGGGQPPFRGEGRCGRARSTWGGGGAAGRSGGHRARGLDAGRSAALREPHPARLHRARPRRTTPERRRCIASASRSAARPTAPMPPDPGSRRP